MHILDAASRTRHPFDFNIITHDMSFARLLTCPQQPPPTNLVYPYLRLLAIACRYVFAVKLAPGQQLRRVLPATEADAERLMRYLADSE
jgi:hypothetical protein